MHAVRRSLILSAVTCASALAPASLAGAVAPDATPSRVVPAKAIGGVFLDQPFRKARAAWGRGRCGLRPGVITNGGGDSQPDETDSWECVYGESIRGYARFQTTGRMDEQNVARESAVTLIEVEAGRKSTDAGPVDVFVRPYTRFRTRQGIGLGSRLSALRTAFPRLERTQWRTSGLQLRPQITYLRMDKAGAGASVFGVSEKRVVQIIVCKNC